MSVCHISSTGESVENVCAIDLVSLVASAFISVMFDFDKRNTFLLVGLARVMVAVSSRRIAAWSLTPTTSSVPFANFLPGCLLVLFVLSLGPLSCSGKGRLVVWDISLCRGWAWWNQLASQCQVS